MITKTELLNPNSVTWRTSDTMRDTLTCLYILTAAGEEPRWSIRFSFDWMPFLDQVYVCSDSQVTNLTLKQRLTDLVEVSDVLCDANLIIPFTAEFSKDGEVLLRATFDRIDGG